MEDQKFELTGLDVSFDVKATWLAINKMYSPLADLYGLTVTMGFVLANIHEDYGTAATKIAPLLGMEPRSLTRLLKKMEEDNLINRVQDETDKRSVRIHLTSKGLEMKRIALEHVTAFNQEIREKVSDRKMKIFFEVIEAIYETADTREIVG
ncbi:MAG: MarR family transcriptional regulator [Bacteroidia bacterium]|nr:MarR family transcriptional regulator [Bacteroidia bacterium]